jgi:dipeptidyl aminopeptidase/acylaminoacyl peptidase
MHDMTSFESRLSERLAAEFGSGIAFEPNGIARAAMTKRGIGANLMNRLGLANGLTFNRSSRLAMLAVVALLIAAMAAIALGVGRLLDRPPGPAEPRLAYVNQPGDLVLANSDGTDAALLVAGNGSNEVGREGFGFGDVLWAPGGDHLLATQARSGGIDLVILDRAGHVTVRTDLPAPSQYAWSPDGRRVAVLWGVDVTAGLTDPDPLIQFGALDVRLDLIPADGSPSTSAALARFSFARDVRGLAWSPDGKQVALAGVIATGTSEGVESHIWIIDPETGDAEQVTSDPGAFDYAPAWSRDGRLYFARHDGNGHSMWRLDRDGLNPVKVADWNGYVGTILPSRDGSRLAVINQAISPRADSGPIQQPRIGVLEVDSGAVTELLPPGKPSLDSSIAWGLDDASVVWMDSSLNPLAELTQTDLTAGSVAVLASRIVSFDIAEPAH